MKSLYLLILSSLIFTTTELRSQDAPNGKELFNASCKSCHTIGKGKIVGPDLKDVHTRRKEDWLVKFITSPATMIKSGDETSKQLFEENNKILMPDHTFLKEAEIKDIIAFIKEESAPKEVAQAATQDVKTETKVPEVQTEIKQAMTFPDYFLYSLLTISVLLLVLAFFLLFQVYNFVKK